MPSRFFPKLGQHRPETRSKENENGRSKQRLYDCNYECKGVGVTKAQHARVSQAVRRCRREFRDVRLIEGAGEEGEHFGFGAGGDAVDVVAFVFFVLVGDVVAGQGLVQVAIVVDQAILAADVEGDGVQLR